MNSSQILPSIKIINRLGYCHCFIFVLASIYLISVSLSNGLALPPSMSLVVIKIVLI